MAWAWWLSILALASVAGLGVRAMFDPHWAARFVRFKPDEQDGGFAEFRATYGGMLAFAHGVALVLSLRYVSGGEHIVGLTASGAAIALAAGWAGAACGRVLSMWRDRTRTRFNLISAGVEAGLATTIAAPWLVWFFSAAD